ncbi:MAG: hypothetical protein Q8L89_09015 [Gammaproteobacteria bacterium]|nr:hypothetical protein [Gammaproteobacteria bacterium]
MSKPIKIIVTSSEGVTPSLPFVNDVPVLYANPFFALNGTLQSAVAQEVAGEASLKHSK